MKAELRARLSSGLSSGTLERRDGYWRDLSKNFYGAFGSTRDTGEALKYSFCATAAEKYSDWVIRDELSGLLAVNYFVRIFEYCYGAVEKYLNTL